MVYGPSSCFNFSSTVKPVCKGHSDLCEKTPSDEGARPIFPMMRNL